MKQILPPNVKISKEAKETMQECASEFISFVTGEASDKCHKEKRKTPTAPDAGGLPFSFDLFFSLNKSKCCNFPAEDVPFIDWELLDPEIWPFKKHGDSPV